jgi:hypothetical protein
MFALPTNENIIRMTPPGQAMPHLSLISDPSRLRHTCRDRALLKGGVPDRQPIVRDRTLPARTQPLAGEANSAAVLLSYLFYGPVRFGRVNNATPHSRDVMSRPVSAGRAVYESVLSRRPNTPLLLSAG